MVMQPTSADKDLDCSYKSDVGLNVLSIMASDDPGSLEAYKLLGAQAEQEYRESPKSVALNLYEAGDDWWVWARSSNEMTAEAVAATASSGSGGLAAARTDTFWCSSSFIALDVAVAERLAREGLRLVRDLCGDDDLLDELAKD